MGSSNVKQKEVHFLYLPQRQREMTKPFPKMSPETKLNRACKPLETSLHTSTQVLWAVGRPIIRDKKGGLINVKSVKTNPHMLWGHAEGIKTGLGIITVTQ